MNRRWALALALLALAACTDPRDPADGGARAAQVAAFHGATPAVRAAITARVQEQGRDPETVSVHLWSAADGRLRVKLAKLDVEVLDLLLRPDGSYLAWAPRAGETAQGRLADAGTPALLPRLRLIAGEFTEGPLPRAARARADGALLRWDADGLEAELETAADGSALRKRLRAGGEERLVLDYSRYRAFEGLQRAGRLRLAGAGLEVTAVLRDLNPVGDISADGMRVEPRADARVVPVADLLEHLDR